MEPLVPAGDPGSRRPQRAHQRPVRQFRHVGRRQRPHPGADARRDPVAQTGRVWPRRGRGPRGRRPRHAGGGVRPARRARGRMAAAQRVHPRPGARAAARPALLQRDPRRRGRAVRYGVGLAGVLNEWAFRSRCLQHRGQRQRRWLQAARAGARQPAGGREPDPPVAHDGLLDAGPLAALLDDPTGRRALRGLGRSDRGRGPALRARPHERADVGPAARRAYDRHRGSLGPRPLRELVDGQSRALPRLDPHADRRRGAAGVRGLVRAVHAGLHTASAGYPRQSLRCPRHPFHSGQRPRGWPWEDGRVPEARRPVSLAGAGPARSLRHRLARLPPDRRRDRRSHPPLHYGMGVRGGRQAGRAPGQREHRPVPHGPE